MQPRLISVIIPAYNAEKYISQAIESVLAQTYRPLEIVVVDDGSTDGTAAIACSCPAVRCIHQPNQGIATARNTGLATSTGELVAFLDADDCWDPHKLLEQSNYLAAHSELGCVSGRWRNFLEKGVEKPRWVADSMLEEDAVCSGLQASLIHRWVFDQVGDFNARYRIAQDVEWFFRVRDAGIPIAFTPSVMVYRRIHNANVSQDQRAVVRATLRILKEHIDRKRSKSLETLPGARI
jgi:glycosyltransferase involved in cell wall biosynthesis